MVRPFHIKCQCGKVTDIKHATERTCECGKVIVQILPSEFSRLIKMLERAYLKDLSAEEKLAYYLFVRQTPPDTLMAAVNSIIDSGREYFPTIGTIKKHINELGKWDMGAIKAEINALMNGGKYRPRAGPHPDDVSPELGAMLLVRSWSELCMVQERFFDKLVNDMAETAQGAIRSLDTDNPALTGRNARWLRALSVKRAQLALGPE